MGEIKYSRKVGFGIDKGHRVAGYHYKIRFVAVVVGGFFDDPVIVVRIAYRIRKNPVAVVHGAEGIGLGNLVSVQSRKTLFAQHRPAANGIGLVFVQHFRRNAYLMYFFVGAFASGVLVVITFAAYFHPAHTFGCGSPDYLILVAHRVNRRFIGNKIYSERSEIGKIKQSSAHQHGAKCCRHQIFPLKILFREIKDKINHYSHENVKRQYGKSGKEKTAEVRKHRKKVSETSYQSHSVYDKGDYEENFVVFGKGNDGGSNGACDNQRSQDIR